MRGEQNLSVCQPICFTPNQRDCVSVSRVALRSGAVGLRVNSEPDR